MLQEGIGDHDHQGATMKTLPGSPLEVIKPKLRFQLLMRLFANPSCLDSGGYFAQICRGRQIGEIVFLLAGGALLADEPSFVAWQMLLTLIPYSLRNSSAVRTRIAANRAFSRPLVPLRQLTVFQLALASMSSARSIEYLSRGAYLAEPRNFVIGQMSCTPNDTP